MARTVSTPATYSLGNGARIASTAAPSIATDEPSGRVNVAIGSSTQVALFVAPSLVFLSYAFGNPMDLRFTLFEVLALSMAVAVVNLVAQDGESHWMEGVLLLAVYLIIGIAFYFLPA